MASEVSIPEPATFHAVQQRCVLVCRRNKVGRKSGQRVFPLPGSTGETQLVCSVDCNNWRRMNYLMKTCSSNASVLSGYKSSVQQRLAALSNPKAIFVKCDDNHVLYLTWLGLILFVMR